MCEVYKICELPSFGCFGRNIVRVLRCSSRLESWFPQRGGHGSGLECRAGIVVVVIVADFRDGGDEASAGVEYRDHVLDVFSFRVSGWGSQMVLPVIS